MVSTESNKSEVAELAKKIPTLSGNPDSSLILILSAVASRQSKEFDAVGALKLPVHYKTQLLVATKNPSGHLLLQPVSVFKVQG